MNWRRRRGMHYVMDQEPKECLVQVGWAYLIEEGEVVCDRLERCYDELGTQGYELVRVIPLSRLAFSGGGYTTGTHLFFKRRLP